MNATTFAVAPFASLTRRDLAVLCYLRRQGSRGRHLVLASRELGRVQRLRSAGLVEGWAITSPGSAVLRAVDALRMAGRLVDELERRWPR